MDTTAGKIAQAFIVIAIFGVVVAGLLWLADRGRHRSGKDRWQTAVFLVPAILLMVGGLAYPALRTFVQAFFDKAGEFIGLDNFVWMFTQPDILVVLRNTLLWVILTPVVSTAIGLGYALAVDGLKIEPLAKSLIFLPMAISFVGASIIWKFVYAYRADQAGIEQIGLLNELIVSLGGSPQQFLINGPWNTLFLIVILIWIQTGFATVVLSAAIKAVPNDIVEAAKIDGAGYSKILRYIKLPAIKPSIVVVMLTITIATLKVFDIVRTTTGGQFGTSVVANEMYTQAFKYGETGQGAVLAVFLFLLVVPVVLYQIRQVRREQKEVR